MPDIGDDDRNLRLFGPQPDQPLELPGIRGRDHFRAIAEQDMPGSVAAAATLPPSKTSPADRARAAALVQELAKLLRNTNITASLPAHDSPGLWSLPIDLSASFALPSAVGPYTTVLSYKVPSGRWARIESYGVDVGGGFTYDGSILWRIRVDGLNVPDLADWGQHRGTIVQPRNTFFLVPPDKTVIFQVRRAVAGIATSQVVMALLGYTWRLRRNDEGTKASITAF